MRVLITGSSRGLGYALAEIYAENGHEVLATARSCRIPVYSLSKVAANKAASIIRASVGEQYEVLAIHPGRMNTDMGRTTAQIEAHEAAAGIYEMSTGQREIKNWYVNYLGEKMNS